MPRKIIIIVGAGEKELEKAVSFLNHLASVEASMSEPCSRAIDEIRINEAKLCLTPRNFECPEKDFDLPPKSYQKKSEIFGRSNAHSEKARWVLKNSRKGKRQ